MSATGAMFHLDAAACSIPEPVLLPNALNSQVTSLNLQALQQQISTYDALLECINKLRVEIKICCNAVCKSKSVVKECEMEVMSAVVNYET
ncbi:hypothetical protein DFS33DRAFT_1383789 [Desarmillaria ectypa]|nr:hypothetical protein DFS33DRAFT_1383789 [Desarmillaria ectypa]